MSRPRLTTNDIEQEEVHVTTASGTHGRSSMTPSGTRRAVAFGGYRLFARLGSGGMADVYLALSQSAMNVNRLVVIKRLKEDQTNDAQCREMFLTEARIAARLNHPNVIQTFEAGRQGDSFFIAMEYVDGQPLSRVLTALRQRGEALDPRLAARICSDALSALHYAHDLTDFDGTALEIVHRDVSPQNIMVSYDGVTKLVDFGIAKAVGTAQTAHGVFKGKVAFMAPEQVRGEQVDRRADLFAAGIVLWEAVTGHRLMADRDPAATLYNLLSKEIPRASEVNARVSAELDAILDRALQRDIDARYQTAKEMRDDLEAYIASVRGVSSEEVGDFLKELFAVQREKVQSQVREQLANLSIRSANESGKHSLDLSRTAIRQMTSNLEELDDGFVSAASRQVYVRVGNDLEQGPRRPATFAWLFVSLLALSASGLALVRSQRVEPAPVTVVAPVTATVTAEAPHPSVAPPPPTVAATTAPSDTAVATPSAAPRPRVVYVSPPRNNWNTPPAASTPSVDTSRSAAPTPPTPASAKSPEAPQGRTFRRDL